MTPEGRIKAMVKKALDIYIQPHWRFMPVQTGYGSTALDFLICVNGWFVAIETKKDGKAKLTPLQQTTKTDMEAAGALVFVVYDQASCDRAMKIIHGICINAATRRDAERSEAGQPEKQEPIEQHLRAEQQGETVAEATGRHHVAPRTKPLRPIKPRASGQDQRVTATVICARTADCACPECKS